MDKFGDLVEYKRLVYLAENVMSVWAEFNWLRITSNKGALKNENKPSGSIDGENFLD
jgi:hypothetical protein